MKLVRWHDNLVGYTLSGTREDLLALGTRLQDVFEHWPVTTLIIPLGNQSESVITVQAAATRGSEAEPSEKVCHQVNAVNRAGGVRDER